MTKSTRTNPGQTEQTRPEQTQRSRWTTWGLGLIAVSVLSTTGCQVDVGGQTLPSPYYIYDDVQYYPAGPEFKLSREAAAMKAYKEDAPSSSE